ncbi:MAG TPA: hypothetical protein PL033_00275 [Candidatus Brocadiia bacterium]|nr:hypothetical protein [Candidatus Brocadiia bacterium]
MTIRACFEHFVRLKKEMSAWLDQSIRLDPVGSQGGGEDEANYALSWIPHYLIAREEKTAAHFHNLFSQLAGWVERECLHGYEPEAEAHHGTEPFLLFLPRYIALFPDKKKAVEILDDAAHHIGNWAVGFPQWYDYDKDCFRSYHLGTRVVRDENKWKLEAAEHLRFVHIALAAYRVTGNEQYREWALRYGRKRARLLIESGYPVPLLWDQAGRPVLRSDLQSKGGADMSGEGHHAPDDPLAGIENMLASGAVNAFGDLFALSGDEIFMDASRHVIAPLIEHLADPFGDPGIAAISFYRRAFNDDSLDEAILGHIGQFPPVSDDELAMVFPEVQMRDSPGVGRRKDMIHWGYWNRDGSVRPYRQPCTPALTLAFQITGDERFAAMALKQAARKLCMARRVLRGGREHSDMGGAVCSVAAGHGRNWGIGAVTGCYGPLILGTMERFGEVVPLVEFRNQTPPNASLPAGVVSLVIPPVGRRKGEIRLFNAGTESARVEWKPTAETEWRKSLLNPGECVTQTIENTGAYRTLKQ